MNFLARRDRGSYILPMDAPRERRIPIFPLELVLFPHMPLPLHIFEPRYREMTAWCLEQKQDFGVVLFHQGHLHRTGTLATIESVLERLPDGRMNILCLGRGRFEILEVLEEKSYLEARVLLVKDDPSPLEKDLLRLSEQGRCLLDEYAELSGKAPQTSLFSAFDPEQMSFLLAEINNYSLPEQQRLLEMRSSQTRLEQTVQAQARHNQRLRLNRDIKEVLGKDCDCANLLN